MIEIFTGNVFFGLVISFATVEFGKFLFKKFKFPIFNPFLVSVIIIIAVLKIFDIPYANYMIGGDLLRIFLGPATVVLGILLYRQIEFLKKYFLAVILGGLSGCVVSAASVIILCKLFQIDKSLILSILPKSITTPVGIELTNMIGGTESITVIAISVTGVIGGILSPLICSLAGIKEPIAVGVSIGTATHMVGTSRAIEIGELEGAMSATSIVISALITILVVPIAVKFL